MNRHFLSLLWFLLLPVSCVAQDAPSTAADSTTTCPLGETPLASRLGSNTPPTKKQIDLITQSRLFRATYVGLPLVVGGLIEKRQDHKFRGLRNDFLPHFRRNADNYTQFLPAALMAGMKVADVPSRSSWGRMLLSDALSAALMTTVVQVSKNTTHVWRPDGSNNHSFPSGHTATAFMTAAMLSKEYGHLSPWLSVGAYTVASATGLMRMANNKHWLSDVMVGAGVGILSTEFGYWIADALMKKRGLNLPATADDARLWNRKPSFLGYYSGFNIPLSHYDINETNTFETSTGTTVGLEGAWFPGRYIGIGGRASISNVRLIVNGNEAADNTLDFYSVYAGPYFSLPLSVRWEIATKLLAGYTWYMPCSVGGFSLPANSGWGAGTGISLNVRMHRNLGFSIFLDYNLQPPHNRHSGEYMHVMTLGARASIRF